ncbi:MAG: hypothetical protein OHK005_17680 [Candidatus Methylacidiphilales bacterium]
MSDQPEFELVASRADLSQPKDPGASPFKTVVDPALRLALRKALIDLINDHEERLSQFVADGDLRLDSYKEYIELYARSLRETMSTREGVGFLLRSAGFDVAEADINLEPAWRWRNRDQA